MLGSEAITLMKRRLTRNTAATVELDTWIEDELVQAQQRLERLPTLPWFLLTEKSFITITKDEERIIIPANFLRENPDDDMQVFDTDADDWTELRKGTIDAMRIKFPDEAGGRPREYDYAGQYFRMRPIPNLTTYQLYMTYFRRDATFTVGVENDWLKHFPDLLISEAGIPLAIGLRNDAAKALFEGLRTIELKRLDDDMVAREMANYDPNPED